MMFYNHYSVMFRKLPLTIQDQSSNLLRFFEHKQPIESPIFQTIPNCLKETVIQQIHQDYNNHKDEKTSPLINHHLLQQIVQELSPLVPSTFQRRSFIGFTDISCSSLSSSSLEKVNPSFDEDGNFSLLSLFVFLEPFASSIVEKVSTPSRTDASKEPLSLMNWVTTHQTFPIHPTPGLGILFDHRIGYSVPVSVNNKNPLVLRLKCLYSLLPEKTFSLPLYDQVVLWRGQMKKCFMNSGSFISSGQSSSFRINVSHLEDPLKEQCESCLQFIPITSTTCPVCSDRLIPQTKIISSRKKGIWISKNLYTL